MGPTPEESTIQFVTPRIIKDGKFSRQIIVGPSDERSYIYENWKIDSGSLPTYKVHTYTKLTIHVLDGENAKSEFIIDGKFKQVKTGDIFHLNGEQKFSPSGKMEFTIVGSRTKGDYIGFIEMK